MFRDLLNSDCPGRGPNLGKKVVDRVRWVGSGRSSSTTLRGLIYLYEPYRRRPEGTPRVLCRVEVLSASKIFITQSQKTLYLQLWSIECFSPPWPLEGPSRRAWPPKSPRVTSSPRRQTRTWPGPSIRTNIHESIGRGSGGRNGLLLSFW